MQRQQRCRRRVVDFGFVGSETHSSSLPVPSSTGQTIMFDVYTQLNQKLSKPIYCPPSPMQVTCPPHPRTSFAKSSAEILPSNRRATKRVSRQPGSRSRSLRDRPPTVSSSSLPTAQPFSSKPVGILKYTWSTNKTKTAPSGMLAGLGAKLRGSNHVYNHDDLLRVTGECRTSVTLSVTRSTHNEN